MAHTNRSRIAELAAIIQSQTADIDAYCTAEGIPSPSFDVDYPSNLPPSIEKCRNSVLEATDELSDLMLGAQQIAECQPPQHTSLIGIQAICRYDIAQKVKPDEEVSYAELAERCGLPKGDLTRILRQAMSKHIFKEPRKGFVAHTAASKVFMDSPHLKDWIYIALEEVWPSATRMLDAMDKWRSGAGEPNETGFNLAKNIQESFFESMKDNERRKTAFSNAMTYMQSRQGFGFSASQLLSSYDWASAATVVDIGGGHGTTCVHIAQSNPSIRCIVQDLPDIVAKGERLIPSEVADKITFMAHDFFTEQPVKDADVYFLRWILHDWSDPKAITILRNLIPALKSGTNIVLQEFILPDPGVVSFYQEKIIRCMDLAMKASFNSHEREISDWIELFIEANPRFKFVGAKVPMGSNLAVLHFRWE